MREQIPIFLAADDGYAPCLATAVVSLMDKASSEYEYKIIVMQEDLSEENRKKIRSLEKEGFDISFVSMKEQLGKMAEKSSNKLRCDYFTLTIYYRIFIADMFPQYDKGIYIDSDVVVPGDISKLYEVQLQDNLIGGCVDTSIQEVAPITTYIDESLGVDHTHYINSGVLLMNLKKLREVGFADHFLYLLNTYQFDSIAPDQDYINTMCYKKIRFLDGTWDLFPDCTKPEAENPMLIHYNLFEKPWHYEGIVYENLFWKYAKDSGYYDELLQTRNNYSQQEKEEDSRNMQRLSDRALEITECGIRFRDVFDSGKEERI
ncbi:MAG: glycosyltransferase family 8 protein [Lachnospiraceae bacterium]|nr:glycosyltransferase family 8 protein [Lachnospiraceae bacterium]